MLSDGSKHLLPLELCGGESAAAWKGCLDDLVARGLRAPMLCIIDGNPGLRRAVGEVWPRAAVAIVLLFSLVASGQIKLRKIDGWRKIAAVLSQQKTVVA